MEGLVNEPSALRSLPDAFCLRSYQTEMVEESLKQNIIVAMDTGSGKTHIAVSRAAAELETCDPAKFVWFVAPTVSLIKQQCRYFEKHLPAYQRRSFSGDDGVDKWQRQTWEAALKNIRVVLSTPMVLLDALTHGFVQIRTIALLIFDEAHHCTQKHPMNQIMRHFYKPLLHSCLTTDAPCILGLSASPVINSKAKGLEIIEQNMNAITKSPKLHRSELLRFVYQPQLIQITYAETGTMDLNRRNTPAFWALQTAYDRLDLREDPYVKHLLQSTDPDACVMLQKMLISGKTFCQEQMKSLYTGATIIYHELGAYATELYIRKCISKFQRLLERFDYQLPDWIDEEKVYLLSILRNILPHSGITDIKNLGVHDVSSKAQALMDLLRQERQIDFKGIIFVATRATVALLTALLEADSIIKEAYRIGTFVGTSTSTKRKKRLGDLVEPNNQQETLEEFDTGIKNLIIATNVLEEGIDVSSCNVVICFDPPRNLKSFIQRRGRARKQQSKYIIMLSEGETFSSADPDKWRNLEETMRQAYLADVREIRAAEERELIEDEGELTLRVESTGALLTLDNAVQHLHHFCATLRAGPYVDARPQFVFRDSGVFVTAEVILPVSVDPLLRTANSSRSWKTERQAKKDAAFQAYSNLYRAGLVNDNLLPLIQQVEEPLDADESEDSPSLVSVRPRYNPWVNVAICQKDPNVKWFRPNDATPVSAPAPQGITLYWNKEIQYRMIITPLEPIHLSAEGSKQAHNVTVTLLSSVFGTRMHESRSDLLAVFLPSKSLDLKAFTASMTGYKSAEDIFRHIGQVPELDYTNLGLVRMQSQFGRSWICKGFRVDFRETTEDDQQARVTEIPQVVVSTFPRRRDFLHPVASSVEQKHIAYTSMQALDAYDCTIDNLPMRYARSALFIPSILHRFELCMVAEGLRSTVLAPVGIQNVNLVLTAITHTSAIEPVNYQRLEFLGDCILKYCTSVQLMAQHPTWPEGYLTAVKGRKVSNVSLAKASVRTGLDKFIVRKPFTGTRWRPRYANDVLAAQNTEETEQTPQSSKVLADVVESLIGAACIDGGMLRAQKCIATLLPDDSWIPLGHSVELLHDLVPNVDAWLPQLENLLGYTFRKKALLFESITHASFSSYNQSTTLSYQRMEFLGDAILDFIVSKALFAHTPELPHHKMHGIRTAIVNASFLAFLAMEHAVLEERINIVPDDDNSDEFHKVLDPIRRSLWQFMRYTGPAIAEAQRSALARHNVLREQVVQALQHGTEYPWTLLTRIGADKFFSDLVESVLGAIYVDSHGAMEACEGFLERLGLTPFSGA